VNSTFDRPRQNKANLGKPGWDPGSRLCRTKPICAAGAGGQSCQTNPISRRGPVGRGQRGGGRGANAQNEPNCPKRGTEAVSRLRIAGTAPGNRRPPSAELSDWRLRIGHRPAAGRSRQPPTLSPDGLPGGQNAQNEPNLAQPGQGQVPGGRKMRNEANSCRSWTSMRVKRSQFPPSARAALQGTARITPHGVTGAPNAEVCVGAPRYKPRAHCAKRTQFRRVGRRAEYPGFHYSIIPPFQADVDCAKRSQTWAGWAIWGTAHQGGRLCKTNPILPVGQGPRESEMGKTNPICQRQSCETKPNLGAPGVSGGPPRAGSLSCETKPIRQGQSCETKPIPGPVGRRPGDGERGAIVRNKANFTGRPEPQRMKCAKRTQFPAVPGGQGRRGGGGGPIAQNEANFRQGRVGRSLGEVGRGTNAQNEPNPQPGPWHGHPVDFALRAGFARECESWAVRRRAALQ
jgi:hypothetical protein